MRQAFCCVAGLHPIRVEWIDPDETTVPQFWREWRRVARDNGCELRFHRVFEPDPDQLWIAVVPSLTTKRFLHAIVMWGDSVYYDCNQEQKRVRKPRVVYECIEVFENA